MTMMTAHMAGMPDRAFHYGPDNPGSTHERGSGEVDEAAQDAYQAGMVRRGVMQGLGVAAVKPMMVMMVAHDSFSHGNVAFCPGSRPGAGTQSEAGARPPERKVPG